MSFAFRVEPLKASPDFLVQAFSVEDIKEITENEQRASLHPWQERNFASSLSSGYLCVGLKHKGSWVAHAVCSCVLDELELLILSVVPEFKRRGLASGLLLEVLSQAAEKGARVMHLEVRRSNNSAIALYEKLGFEHVGVRRNYYSAPLAANNGAKEDALLLSKFLRI